MKKQVQPGLIRRLLLAIILTTGLSPPSGKADHWITDIDATGRLVCHHDSSNGILAVETSADMSAENWNTVLYDFASNGEQTVQIDIEPTPVSFYRTYVQSTPADTGLVVHISFDNDSRNGVLLDASGYGHHGRRFGYPDGTNNWPKPIVSLDRTKAGDFDYYYDGWSLGRSGDYAGITNLAMLSNMTNATVCVWAHYHTAYSGDYGEDNNACLLSAGYAVKGAWSFGRISSDYTKLAVFYDDSHTAGLLAGSWPDRTYQTDGNSGGWNHYAFTFDAGTFVTYFNGDQLSSVHLSAVDYLTVAYYFLGIGCQTHNGDPWLDDTDIYPNHGWLNGKLEDVRIYRRVLSDTEIHDLYISYDNQPPSSPANLEGRAASDTVMELRWDPSEDLFGVSTYVIRRNGVTVGTTQGTLFVDTGLSALSSYEYTCRAVDEAGNSSGWSEPVTADTLGAGSALELIVDDADGTGWVTIDGEWYLGDSLSGYWGTGYRDNRKTDQGSKSVVFRPFLPDADEYTLYIRHTQWYKQDTNVPVTVTHSTGETTVYIDQSSGGGIWHSLGAFTFSAGTNGTIRVGTQNTTGYVIADAIRLTD